MGVLAWGIAQPILLVLLAPLVNGVIKKSKAFLQNRRGPGLLQGYYDLQKLFHKDRVVSEHSSWIFRVTPFVVFGAVVATTFIIPVLILDAPLRSAADLFTLVYLLGLARFFTALAGIDAGSSFGGMGSSREMTFSVLIEPALLLGLFTLALSAGSTNFIAISRAFFQPSSLNTAHLLAFFALFIVAVAETGRIPVDNPDTHLELTMVHEGMILEYSGKELGLIVWGTQIKQLIILTFLANLFFPVGIAEQLTITQLGFALMAYLIKVLILALGLAGVETAFAKLRLFKVPSLLGISFMLSVFAMVSVFVIGGKL